MKCDLLFFCFILLIATRWLNLYAFLGNDLSDIYLLQIGRFRIESWWGQDFPPVQNGLGVHPASCTMGTGSSPGVEAAGAWD